MNELFIKRKKYIKDSLGTDDKFSDTEAKSHLGICKKCATDLKNEVIYLRLLIFVMFYRGGLAALNMKKREFYSNVRSVATEGLHRATINRQLLAGCMDFELELPPGEVKESVLRELRTKVLEDARGEVLKKALEEMGSYRKITAKVVVEVAEDLGFLNHRPVGETGGTKATPLSDGDERSSTEPSTEPSPIAGPPSPTTKKIGQDRSDTDSLDAIKASSPLGSLMAKLCKNKRDRNLVRQYLEKSSTDPDLIRKLESLSLEQCQEALEILKNTGQQG